MFTIFIDDSGTAPEHKIAVAAGIVVPTLRIDRLESEWKSFLQKEGISDFHASECLARNPHSAFAAWNDETVRRVFTRVRQLTIRFSVKGFCIGIHKQDYEEVLPQEMRAAIGESFYSWALSSVLGLAYDWANERKVPMEYIFDNATGCVRREIEHALAFSEKLYGDHFSGHYSFRNRNGVAALQAVDLFAWTCFQQFRHIRFNHPIHAIAAEANEGYEKGRDGEWRIVQSLNRQGLEMWVSKNRNNPRTKEIIAFKEHLKEARKPKPKKSGSAK
jgi:hypothetical protein